MSERREDPCIPKYRGYGDRDGYHLRSDFFVIFMMFKIGRRFEHHSHLVVQDDRPKKPLQFRKILDLLERPSTRALNG
jgi:hypothetical protein